MVHTANWGIIWYLPPIKGTRKLPWLHPSTVHNSTIPFTLFDPLVLSLTVLFTYWSTLFLGKASVTCWYATLDVAFSPDFWSINRIWLASDFVKMPPGTRCLAGINGFSDVAGGSWMFEGITPLETNTALWTKRYLEDSVLLGNQLSWVIFVLGYGPGVYATNMLWSKTNWNMHPYVQ